MDEPVTEQEMLETFESLVAGHQRLTNLTRRFAEATVAFAELADVLAQGVEDLYSSTDPILAANEARQKGTT